MKLNFCPDCASPLVAQSATTYICRNGHYYWNNAKAAVAVVILKGDLALFSKRGVTPHKDKYDFPGGFVDYGENAWQALIREMKEETGIEIHAAVMIDSTNQQYADGISVCDIIFITTDWSGEPLPQDDVSALEWKPIEFINSDEFAWDYRGVAESIQTYRTNLKV